MTPDRKYRPPDAYAPPLWVGGGDPGDRAERNTWPRPNAVVPNASGNASSWCAGCLGHDRPTCCRFNEWVGYSAKRLRAQAEISPSIAGVRGRRRREFIRRFLAIWRPTSEEAR